MGSRNILYEFLKGQTFKSWMMTNWMTLSISTNNNDIFYHFLFHIAFDKMRSSVFETKFSIGYLVDWFFLLFGALNYNNFRHLSYDFGHEFYMKPSRKINNGLHNVHRWCHILLSKSVSVLSKLSWCPLLFVSNMIVHRLYG